MKATVVLILMVCLSMAQEHQEIIYEQQIIDPLPTPPPESFKQPEPEPTTIPQQQEKRPFKFDINMLKQYQKEMLIVSVILFYLMIYVRGKKANVALMQKFYRKVAGCLQTNFAHIGYSKTSGEAPFNGQSPSESGFYASGRDNVESIQIKFQTKKRQDLLYMILDIFLPDRDTATIDLPIRADLPLVMAIASKKQIKDLSEKHPDIRTMTRQFNVTNLAQGYEVLGEAADTVDSLLDNYVVKKLGELSGLILSIHITDLKIYSESTANLRIVLNLAQKNQSNYLPGLELALYLADKIANLKLSAPSKAKALKSREVYNQSKEKQELEKHNENLRKQKEEKFRQEQSWLRSLPPDKQKKEQEKRKKKEFNKLMKGKTMKL